MIKKILLLSISAFILSGSMKELKPMEINSQRFTVEERQEIKGYWFETIIGRDESKVFRSNSTSGYKTVNYYSGNTLLWSVTVHGTFTYGNGTSKAISSRVTTSTSDKNWKITASNSTFSANTARAEAIAKRYFIGIPVETISRTVELKCDSKGRLT